MHTEEGQVRPRERCCLHVSKSLGESPQAHCGLGCPASGAARKQMSALQASGDALFCHGSPSKLINKRYIESQSTQESLRGLYYDIAKHLHVKKEMESYKLKIIIYLTKV